MAKNDNKYDPETEKEPEVYGHDGKLRVIDMVISDEFILADSKTSGKKISKMILDHKGTAILIKKGKKVIGLVNEYSLLEAIASGKVKIELNADSLINPEIMEVHERDALEDILPEMYSKQPEAVVVVDDKGHFKGYFSPNDCKLATIKLNFRDE